MSSRTIYAVFAICRIVFPLHGYGGALYGWKRPRHILRDILTLPPNGSFGR